MSNAKILYCLLNSCEGVPGGHQIELQAMGGIVILFLLDQYIYMKYGFLSHFNPPLP